MTTPTEQAPHQHATLDSLLPEFREPRLNSTGMAKASLIRQAFSAALHVVETAAPNPSRARSIVVTKLQEGLHFALMAVADEALNVER